MTGGNITSSPAGTKVSALKVGLTLSAAATVEILVGTGGAALAPTQAAFSAGFIAPEAAELIR